MALENFTMEKAGKRLYKRHLHIKCRLYIKKEDKTAMTKRKKAITANYRFAPPSTTFSNFPLQQQVYVRYVFHSKLCTMARIFFADIS